MEFHNMVTSYITYIIMIYIRASNHKKHEFSNVLGCKGGLMVYVKSSNVNKPQVKPQVYMLTTQWRVPSNVSFFGQK